MFNVENAFKLTPCRPEPCDYDVCGSDDDITDKDLTDLLKEEAAKVVNEDALDASKVAKESKEGKEGKESQKQQEKEIAKKKEPNEGELEQREKKRPCRKIIKNPFFTNRLKFSTDLPPRPPVPPPQFFPLADEDSKPKVCPKKKKCKKKKGGSKLGIDGEDNRCGSKGRKGGDGSEGEECDGEGKDGDGKDGDGKDGEGQECDNGFEKDKPCECKCEEDPNKRARRPCKKSKEYKSQAQGPCRKKVSETSIPPQPRRIPALLKDLPLTCPKDIPEVERQIWMSRDNSPPRTSCKKKCKKKEKIEQLLNQ